MKAVLPGRPESRLQALSTGVWGKRLIIAYISGNSLAILGDAESLLQTIYDDDDQTLEAVALDEASGRIAACTATTVRIYKPFGEEEDALKWALQHSVPIEPPSDDTKRATDAFAPTLSWGSTGELLVSGYALALYTVEDAGAPACSWRKPLPSPAKFAAFSYDGAYIASAGEHDPLTKVWRRLSYVTDEIRFDFMYLKHPAPVTSLQWRKPHHVDQTIDNVLYTFCADNFLRVWTRSDSHSCHHLQLWGKVDLAASLLDTAIQDGVRAKSIWAFIIQGRDLTIATEKAVQAGGDVKKQSAALRQLINVANRSSEICVVMDGRGAMSALSLENVGSKRQKTDDVVTITQLVSKDLDFLKVYSGESAHVEIHNYCNRSGSGHLQILIQPFGGGIDIFEANIAQLLDETSKAARITRRGAWSGHSSPIRKIVRNFSGHAVVSRAGTGDCVLWKHASGHDEGAPFLFAPTVIPHQGHVHRISVLRKGRFVVFLLHDALVLWDCQQQPPTMLLRHEYKVSGKPLCLLILPRQTPSDSSVAHIATITSEKCGIVWEMTLPAYASASATSQTNGSKKVGIKEFQRFTLDDAGDLAYVLPVDPAGSTPPVSGFLDVFAQDAAISYTHTGRVEFWAARINKERETVEWLSTSSMETGVSEPALVSGSTMKKAALVNSSRSAVTIWDIRGARAEYVQEFENETVQDLDWTSSPDHQSILAIGFPHRVLLLVQLRFDYLNKGPAWAPLREISIRDLTPHPIGDSTWLGDGHLVIGAGNQLFVYDRSFDTSSSHVMSLPLPSKKHGMWDLFGVVQRLNGPLPVFHPQFLSQCMLAGKAKLVHRVLLCLHNILKFWSAGDPLDDYLGLDPADFLINEDASADPLTTKDTYLSRSMSYDDTDATFTEEVAQSLCDKLTKVGLPQLSGHEQIQLVDMVECAGMVEKQRRSLDEDGARFMLFFRQHALRKGRTNEMHMSWREICWAYHSTSQDILVDFVGRQHHGALMWESARESGMFMWLGDNAAVKAQFEKIARNEYTKSEVKNPVDCSLFYLALRKKTVLQGLWRMASWNKEQGATQRLLANNFEDPKWKSVALKNAYALLSKRRFEYAAAFFLLADSLQDAVNVCLNQVKDFQLAIAIARVYEGDQGPVLRKLLEEEVLNVAAQEGNRWLASWAFWMLHRRDMAVRALITPVYTLLETPGSPDIKSRLYLTDDPALIVLYAQLRQKTLQALRGASKVTPKVEWEFVLHSARLYNRLGCDLLGLSLVRNWEFLQGGPGITPGLGGDVDPRKLLRRRSSMVVDDLPSPVAAKFPGEMKSGPGRPQKQAPTVFEEPDASSLLDSFGF